MCVCYAPALQHFDRVIIRGFYGRRARQPRPDHLGKMLKRFEDLRTIQTLVTDLCIQRSVGKLLRRRRINKQKSSKGQKNDGSFHLKSCYLTTGNSTKLEW